MIKIFHHALGHAHLNRVVDWRKGRSCLDLHYHSKHVKGTINNQLKKFTPLGLVSYGAVIYFGPGGGRGNNGGVHAPGAFLFFYGHLPQTSSFRSAEQIFVANFRFTSWARISSGHNMFCTLWGGRIMAGSNAPGAFLVVVFFWWSLAPDLQFSLGQTNTRHVFRYTG